VSQQKKQDNLGTSVASTASTQTFFMKWGRWNLFLHEYFKGDDKKIEMLCGHFKYEVDMLRLADSKIDEFKRKRNEFERKGNESKCRMYQQEENMALETFLVHWRGLIEFFYSDCKRKIKGKTDDARAWDFIEKSLLEKIRSPEPSWLEKAKERTNKEIAHLTYSRYSGNPPTKDWCYKEMKAHLKKIINLFNEQVNLKFNLNLKYWGR